MVNLWRCIRGTALLLSCAVLFGCAQSTSVSVTGNLPAQYTHAWVTAQAIWFNTNATASPTDTAWVKFQLTTPVTFDLLDAANGTLLTQVMTGLKVPGGTYALVRLIPVDASAALVASASSAGAIYNCEADYYDTGGTLHQVPMELQNPDQGFAIATTLKVLTNYNNSLAGFGSAGSSNGTPSSTASNTSKPVALTLSFNGARDLVPFTYNTSVTGVLLNPHPIAYDTSAAGAVQGTISTSGLSVLASGSNRPDIQVTAEALSSDGTRHIAVNSAPIRADGTFVLYPLATSSSSSSTSYDLVVHGPGLATVIIKGVSVSAGDPTTTTPTSIGTITPRSATSFKVSLDTTSPLPAGSLVGFYQTLPGTGEVPYLIEERPIDPFGRGFATDEGIAVGTVAVSADTLDYGTFSASGSSVTVTTTTASEGASTYRVSATAPLFTDGTPTTSNYVSPTTTVVALPALSVASGAISSSMTVQVSEAFGVTDNQGELVVSHDGAIVATMALDTLLQGLHSGLFTISGLPGGSSSAPFDSAIYYLSVRTWNTATATAPTCTTCTTVHRQFYPNALDLSKGSVGGVSILID